ncbi:glycoside hydrolase family 16 protein [Nocardioides sp. P5_C9_2]
MHAPFTPAPTRSAALRGAARRRTGVRRSRVRRTAIACAALCTAVCGCLALSRPDQAGAQHGPGAPDGPHRAATARTGTGTLVVLPPVAQSGGSPATPPDSSQVVATFRPVRPGRTVLLERGSRHGWRIVDRAREDRAGSASFDVAAGLYRARVEGTDRATAATTGRVHTRAWRTTFEDTFDGTALDLSVWNDQVRAHESVFAPRTCGRSDPAPRSVGSGVLHLGLAPDPELVGIPCVYSHPTGSGTHDFFVYSQVATEHTHFFRYGIFAARMRVQRARGMHSAFWMLPRDRAFVLGDPSAGTEVDVVEYFGERDPGRSDIASFIHWYDPGWVPDGRGDVFPRARRVLEHDEEWWEEFHVFSVEWTPEEYVFRVDGREYYREDEAVSRAEHYLVLSMQALDYELDDLSPDEYGDTADVDWVRVYDATSATSRPRGR